MWARAQGSGVPKPHTIVLFNIGGNSLTPAHMRTQPYPEKHSSRGLRAGKQRTCAKHQIHFPKLEIIVPRPLHSDHAPCAPCSDENFFAMFDGLDKEKLLRGSEDTERRFLWTEGHASPGSHSCSLRKGSPLRLCVGMLCTNECVFVTARLVHCHRGTAHFAGLSAKGGALPLQAPYLMGQTQWALCAVTESGSPHRKYGTAKRCPTVWDSATRSFSNGAV